MEVHIYTFNHFYSILINKKKCKYIWHNIKIRYFEVGIPCYSMLVESKGLKNFQNHFILNAVLLKKKHLIY